MPKKRFKSIIVLSDSEDSSDDDDFHQSHRRKRPIPRSSGRDNITGVNSGPTPSLPDLILLSSDDTDSTTCSDDIILIDDDDDDDDSNRAGTSTYKNLTLPTSDDPDSSTCSDDVIIISDDDDSNTGDSSIYSDNFPSDSEESSATEERTPLCNIPDCFLEDIISPTSIYVTNFQATKEELVERMYNLYNRTVFEHKLPEKMDIVWSKRLTSAVGQCSPKLENDRRFSVIELSEKVCDSAVRVQWTLAHEMCHAACWIIDGDDRPIHGPLWQSYARRVTEIHPEVPEVTERHNFVISYKYNYHCAQCDKEIGRFKKIADNKRYCRKCGGRLRQVSIS